MGTALAVSIAVSSFTCSMARGSTLVAFSIPLVLIASCDVGDSSNGDSISKTVISKKTIQHVINTLMRQDYQGCTAISEVKPNCLPFFSLISATPTQSTHLTPVLSFFRGGLSEQSSDDGGGGISLSVSVLFGNLLAVS